MSDQFEPSIEGSQRMVRIEEFEIGEIEVGPLFMAVLNFTRPNVDVIIGTNLFQERAVWFDFAMGELAIEPAIRDVPR